MLRKRIYSALLFLFLPLTGTGSPLFSYPTVNFVFTRLRLETGVESARKCAKRWVIPCHRPRSQRKILDWNRACLLFSFEFPHRIQATLLIIAAQLLRQVYHLDPKLDPEQEKSWRSEDHMTSGFADFRNKKGWKAPETNRLNQATSAHNPEVEVPNPSPATINPVRIRGSDGFSLVFITFLGSLFLLFLFDPNRDPYGILSCSLETGHDSLAQSSLEAAGEQVSHVFAACGWDAVVTWA